LHDGLALRDLAKSLDLKIEKEKIYLDGKEVSAALRTPLIDKNISLVVAHPEVREVMVALQRKLAASNDFVVEGRDITTVVFPNAEFKFYLDADFEIRAQRRYEEVVQKKIDIDFKELSEDLRKRDEADKNRKTGPLRLSPDAFYIDTTNLTIEEVVDKLAAYMKK
jgi:cytidylate kinase